MLFSGFFVATQHSFSRAGRGGSYRSSSSSSRGYTSSSSSSSSYRSSSSHNSTYSSSSSTSSSSESYVAHIPDMNLLEDEVEIDLGKNSVTQFKEKLKYEINKNLLWLYREFESSPFPLIFGNQIKSSVANVSKMNQKFQIENKVKGGWKPGEKIVDIQYSTLNSLLHTRTGYQFFWRHKVDSSTSKAITRIKFPFKPRNLKINLIDNYSSKYYSKKKLQYKLLGNEILIKLIKHSYPRTIEVIASFPLNAGFTKSPTRIKYGWNTNDIKYQANIFPNGIVKHDLSIKQKLYSMSKLMYEKYYNIRIPPKLKFNANYSSDLFVNDLTGNVLPKVLGRNNKKNTFAPKENIRLKKNATSIFSMKTLGQVFVNDDKAMIRLPLWFFEYEHTWPTAATFIINFSKKMNIDKNKIKTRLFVMKQLTYAQELDYVYEVPAKTTWSNKNSLMVDLDTFMLRSNNTFEVMLEMPASYFSTTFNFFQKLYFAWKHDRNLGFKSNSFYIDWLYTLIFFLTLIFIIYLIRKIINITREARGKFSHKKNLVEKVKKMHLLEAQILSSILKRDENFDIIDFKSVISERILVIQQAWSYANLKPVRAYLSQGMYNSLSTQLSLMLEQEQLKNVIDNFEILDINLIKVEFGETLMTLHIEYVAQARDITMPISSSDEEVKKELKKTNVLPYREIYTLIRNRKNTNNAKWDIAKGQCPACGFEVENISQSNRCNQCKNFFNSGNYGWVLTKITQAIEFNYKPPITRIKSPPTIDNNLQLIEDRATAIFWQLLNAHSKGNKKLIKCDVCDNFYANFNPQKIYLKEPVIGGVVSQKVFTNNDNEYEVKVNFKWSASLNINTPPVNRKSQIIMVKKPTQQKNKTLFATPTCSNCGGPIDDSIMTSCQYCNKPFEAKAGNWLAKKAQLF